MTIDQANKQKWSDTVEKLRKQLNLSHEEATTIKEWGVALLVTGVSAWILYRIVRKLFGPSKKTVKIKVEQPTTKAAYEADDSSPKANPTKRSKSPRKNPLYTSSPWFPLIKRYVGPLMVLLVKRQINRYLRVNKIIR